MPKALTLAPKFLAAIAVHPELIRKEAVSYQGANDEVRGFRVKDSEVEV